VQISGRVLNYIHICCLAYCILLAHVRKFPMLCIPLHFYEQGLPDTKVAVLIARRLGVLFGAVKHGIVSYIQQCLSAFA